MYRVSILALNSKFVHSSLSVWCLYAGLKEYGDKDIVCKVIEQTVNNDMHRVCEEVLATNPDMLGISCYIWNISKVYELVGLLKQERPDLVITLGGPEVSYCQKDVLCKHPEIAYVLSGEGELPFAQLVNALKNNTSLDEVLGLTYRNGNEIIVKEPHISTYEPPSPYTPEFLDSVNKRIVYFETNRGCPFSCDFCLSGRCGSVHNFDLDSCLENLVKLANSGTSTIKFVDRTFNANRERSKKIIRFIIENTGVSFPCDVCFHFEVAGDILDDETIDLLVNAPKGLFQLEIGMQSFNEKTLAYINRRTNTTKLKENIRRLLVHNNMHVHIDLIVGLPLEDMESFKESFNVGYMLKAHMIQVGFLKILKGATMHDNTEKYHYNYHDYPPYEIIDTPWLSAAEMSEIHYLEDAVERLYNSGRFRYYLDYLLSVTGINPFDLFMRIGKEVNERIDYRIDLDDYTKLIYEFGLTLPDVDKMKLRDVLVLDRLATINTGRLPDCLKIPNKKSKHYRLMLAKQVPENKGVKRGLELLYHVDKLVYVDYINQDPITKRYQLTFVDLASLQED